MSCWPRNRPPDAVDWDDNLRPRQAAGYICPSYCILIYRSSAFPCSCSFRLSRSAKRLSTSAASGRKSSGLIMLFYPRIQVAGILTESSFSTGGSKPDFSVVGIGVNLNLTRTLPRTCRHRRRYLATKPTTCLPVHNSQRPSSTRLSRGMISCLPEKVRQLLQAYPSRINCLRKQ